MSGSPGPAGSGPQAARAFPTVRWQWCAFGSLQPAELYAALALRAAVFVVEQGCAFLDLDGHDANAHHLLGWRAAPAGEAEVLVAYLRVLPPGQKYAEPSIGRVVTHPGHRGIGFGWAVMEEGVARARAAFPGFAIRIGAQQHLHRFYERFGFAQASAPYDEDGIAHIEMLLPVPASGPMPG
ncbi:MAG: GNAT family N-acetyltransferase [Betaproteobacteria bacterium]